MKKALFVVLALVATMSLSAQESAQGNEVWRSFDVRSLLIQGEVSYTHGHKVNDNLFVGFGAGVGYYPVDTTTEETPDSAIYNFTLGGPYIPVYVDAKYRLFDLFLSPAFRVKAGGIFNLANIGAGAFATAEFSIDVFRTVSFNVGYSAQALYSIEKKGVLTNSWPTIGIGIEF